MAVATPQYAQWLTTRQLRELSDTLGDPAVVRLAREGAYRAFLELPVEPNPTYRGYSIFGGTTLEGLDPAGSEGPVEKPLNAEATVEVVHDASGTRVEMPDALMAAGVKFRTLTELWKDPSRSAEIFSQQAPTDKLHGLALALTNRAFELVVPDRCSVPVRVRDITVLSRPHESLCVYRGLRVGTQARLLYSEELYSTSEAAAMGTRLYGSLVDLDAAQDSTVRYLTVHVPDPLAVAIYQRHATVGPKARMAWTWAGFGGYRTRTKNLTELPGNGSQVDDLQTMYGAHAQAYESAIQISHIGTDTRGMSMTRGVFRDQAKGVSRGLVRIEKDARKTVSYLSEHAMLLSRGARSETIPVLEILCRDVKATHSTSVAPVDPEKVFYVRSRGIDENDAVRMIGEGFLAHVLDRAPIAELRELLYPLLTARWETQPLQYGGQGLRGLPALSVTDEVAPDEWRFDAKLR
jgi:Fe-S cluster assembly scaffold protein SufB